VVTEEDNLNYEIIWYKYRLGAYSHTPTSGADWTPLSNQYSNVAISQLIENDP
jgi:hypothetical protein